MLRYGMSTRRVAVLLFTAALVVMAPSHADPSADALALVEKGQYDAAVTLLSKAATQENGANRLDTLWLLSDLYRQEGHNRLALGALDIAATLPQDTRAAAMTELRRGGILNALGKPEEAAPLLQRALEQQSLLDVPSQIALLMDIGSIELQREGGESQRERSAMAVARFEAAATLAEQSSLPLPAARARVNAARAQFEAKALEKFSQALQRAAAAVEQLPNAPADLWLGLADLRRRGVNELAFPSGWRTQALSDLQRAEAAAKNPRERAYARGFMGAVYEEQGRTPEALRSTRQAIFLAQEASAREQLYRWEWQLGRLLNARNDKVGAEAAYARAIQVLDGVRSDLSLAASDVFDRLVEPVYSEYAGLLLAKARTLPPGQVQQQLITVRELLESLKKAEVESYFENQCLTDDAQPGKATGNATSPKSTRIKDDSAAVLYPVLLKDRIELLVEVRGVLSQYSTPIGRNQATQVIRTLRTKLEQATSGTEYLPNANSLYDWLIRPTESALQAGNVRTLVIVPAGALRTIPLAALHNGKQFLIERYAVATTPAINLTRELTTNPVTNLLLGGVSEARQGFRALPSVVGEIETVQALFPAKTLGNAAFQREQVTTELAKPSYTAAHFATHGKFSKDYQKSFILTYDGRLTLEDLQGSLQNRGSQPLELLVLSACETAAGDDRAALGLAGVAVQSGAKTAVASLWSISDTATAKLMASFYDNLKEQKQSKAESLRQAQLALIKDRQFQHPSFWAPYLMIGNWL